MSARSEVLVFSIISVVGCSNEALPDEVSDEPVAETSSALEGSGDSRNIEFEKIKFDMQKLLGSRE